VFSVACPPRESAIGILSEALANLEQHPHPSRYSTVLHPAFYIIKREDLKVLSREMDPAEIRLIWWDVVKERGAEVFWKNSPVPHPVRAL
jgi:hypothetical protein